MFQDLDKLKFEELERHSQSITATTSAPSWIIRAEILFSILSIVSGNRKYFLARGNWAAF